MSIMYDNYLLKKKEFEEYEHITYNQILQKVNAMTPYFRFNALCMKVGVNANAYRCCRHRNPAHPMNLDKVDALLTGMEECLEFDWNQNDTELWAKIWEMNTYINLRRICRDCDISFEHISYLLRRGYYTRLDDNNLKSIQGKILELRNL